MSLKSAISSAGWFFLAPMLQVLRLVLGVRYLVFLFRWFPFHKGFPLLLRWNGAKVSRTASFDNFELENPGRSLSNLVVGDRAHIGRGVLLDLADRIEIAENAVLSPRVMVFTHQDVGDRPLSARLPRRQAPVLIRRDAYVGAGAILLHGTTVGAGTVVAAGAVVKGALKDGAVYGGVPQRLIRDSVG